MATAYVPRLAGLSSAVGRLDVAALFVGAADFAEEVEVVATLARRP